MLEFFNDVLHLYDYDTYEALPFTPNGMRVVVLFIWFGVIAAFIGSYYSNNYLGKFVTKLINSGATSPGEAKTLKELNCAGNPILAFSLREGSVLRKTVLAAEDTDADTDTEEGTDDGSTDDKKAKKAKKAKKDKKQDVRTLRFYIPEDKCDKAQIRYRTRGNGIVSLVLSILLSVVILLLLEIFGPWLLGFADGMIHQMGGGAQ